MALGIGIKAAGTTGYAAHALRPILAPFGGVLVRLTEVLETTAEVCEQGSRDAPEEPGVEL